MSSAKRNVIILIQSLNNLGGTEIVALNLNRAFNETGTINSNILSVEHYFGSETNVLSLDDFERATKTNGLSAQISTAMSSCKASHLINFTYENLELLPQKQDWENIGVFHWSIPGYEESIFNLISRMNPIRRLVSVLKSKIRFHHLHKCISNLDIAVSLTNCGKKELQNYISDNNKVVCIPNFLPYNSDCLKISNLNNGTVVFVGRLSREKGVYRLLDIWEKINHTLPKLKLKIYGEGVEKEGMKQVIETRNIKNIEFMGFENNPTKIYQNADLLLMTSDSEGFGMVLVEAMYYGVIPISFDCPVSPKEIIGNAGVIIEPFDINRYVSEIVSLYSNNFKMFELQKNSISRARDFYQPNVINQWKQILNRNTTL